VKILIAFLSVILVNNLSAMIINIPGDYPTIQEGIDICANGDTVLIQPGIYYENLICTINNQTIASLYLTTQDTSYISQTIIDGDNNGTVITYLSNPIDSITVLCGFTIQNGGEGNGIQLGNTAHNSEPVFDHLIIQNNYYGMFLFLGNMQPRTLLRNVITENNDLVGIFIVGGEVLIERSKSRYNGVNGIRSIASTIEMNDILIQYNNSDGMNFDSGSNLTLHHITSSNNLGSGLVFINVGQVQISNSKIISNQDDGISSHQTDLLIENTIVFNNNSDGQGGGLYINGGTYETETIIKNTTIVSNSSYTYGGGIYVPESSPNPVRILLFNSVLWDNEPDQIYMRNDSSNPSRMSTYYSCIENGENGIVCPTYFHYWGEGNIDSNPDFIDFAGEDFHLQDISPCIGAGTDYVEVQPNSVYFPAGIYSSPESDFEGNPRPNPEGSDPDMGAFENPFGEPQVGIENYILNIDEVGLTNHPNPFNPSTTISFNLSNEQDEREVSIYNLKGQKVRTFSNLQISQSQNHQIVWDGTDQTGKPVSSGVYLYKLKIGEFEESKKMLLLR
jgi:hypothetical protein